MTTSITSESEFQDILKQGVVLLYVFFPWSDLKGTTKENLLKEFDSINDNEMTLYLADGDSDYVGNWIQGEIQACGQVCGSGWGTLILMRNGTILKSVEDCRKLNADSLSKILGLVRTRK